MYITSHFLKIATIAMLFFYSYSIASDNFNYDIIKTQRITTKKVIKLLEENKLDSLYSYIDSYEIKNNLSTIQKSIVEINKYLDSSTLSSGLAVIKENYYVISSSYLHNKRYVIQLDFYFNQNEADSKIIKIEVKFKDQLEKERNALIEFDKNNPNFIPPPPTK